MSPTSAFGRARERDVVARERSVGERSTSAIGGEALRGADGVPARSPCRLLRFHRRHLRYRRRHVPGPSKSKFLPSIFLIYYIHAYIRTNIYLCLRNLSSCLQFDVVQYKLSSWLAIVFCAQSLVNMRNVENDLKQISMAMMYAYVLVFLSPTFCLIVRIYVMQFFCMSVLVKEILRVCLIFSNIVK